ncbi:MAG TPA: hypothetical protein VG476_14095 [Acidimicrobiales bacterium]|nr:hypothetical protein [Acidimicrobiales bacterium]
MLTLRGATRLGAGSLAVTLGVLLAACGSGQSRASTSTTRAPHPASPPTTVPPTSPPTTAKPPPPGGRPNGVGLLTLTYVEPAGHVVPAPFAPGGSSAPRRLQVQVRYPSTGAPSGNDTGLAPPQPGGPFPVVVFAPGLNEDPPPYQPLLHDWAQAGFVVAATTFPVTSPSVPNAGDKERDLPNQPYDVTFLIDSLTATASNPSDSLHGLIDPGEIALAGQSDGGNTTVATSFNTAYQDHRVKAAVVLSGARYGYPGGTWFPAGSPPLLATQGTADTINPPPLTNDFFSADPQPNKYLLCLQGAPHLDPYVAHNNYEQVVAQVSIAFLDAELYHQSGALATMMQAGTVPGAAGFSPRCG